MAPFGLRIYERDHNISSSFSDGEAFVEMRQATRMKQHPTAFSVSNRAVISVKRQEH